MITVSRTMGCGRHRNRKRNQLASTSEATTGDRHLKNSKKASASSKTTEGRGGEILRRKKEMLEAYTALEAMEFLGMNNLTSMSAHRTATVIGKISSERLFPHLL
jgi:hypothetical protein